MKRLFSFFGCLLLGAYLVAQTASDNAVIVNYNGDTATVTVADNIAQYITTEINGAHVSIAQSSEVSEEITYSLSGSSSDGGFYVSGSYKATLILNGLDLTNVSAIYSGAAIHIENGKRIKVKVTDGSTNTLSDASNGSQKGCFYVKGHPEFEQSGTLNVIGNTKHAIKAGEYMSVKQATINVSSAAGDGISCNQYFLIESGIINISGTTDDGLQCDLDGDSSTGIMEEHEDEDSGNIYILGGSITMNCPGLGAKGLKSEGDIYISEGSLINISTSGNGRWDEEDLETKAACCISADGNIEISGGSLTLTATGSGGKGIKCDNFMTINGGEINISTSGGLYYHNGTSENLDYTGNTDNINNNYYSSPKGIRVGEKTENGNSYIYSGGLTINGGKISVRTAGTNGEGIESKNTLDINGGEIFVDAYDDGINSGQDMTITNGYIYSRSNNNDGIDANGDIHINGGLVYAIGSRTPEIAIDANSEEGKKVFLNGGILISIGGIEQGASLSQTCYQTTSVSSNTWYSISFDDQVIAFYVPTITTGGGVPGGGGFPSNAPGGGGPGGGGPGGQTSSGLIISTPSSPTLMSGISVNNGQSIFEENAYLEASVQGGTNQTLSIYGNSGGNSSIAEIEELTNVIRIENGTIVIDNCHNCEITIYDIQGRRVENHNLNSGIYLVNINKQSTQKIVVVK